MTPPNIFLGTYWEVLEIAHKLVGIGVVVIEDKPTSQGTADCAARLGVPLVTVGRGQPLADRFPPAAGLVLSAGFGRLFKTPVLARCATVLNFHPGLVETCRGRHTLPVNARRGDAFMGITCHRIDDERIDAGPVIAQVRLPIDYDANFDVNHARLRRFLAPLAEGVLADYRATGRFTALPWDAGPDSYHPPLSPEELETVLTARRLADIAPAPKAGPS
jgi:methionyl-tRNA formyltransferase